MIFPKRTFIIGLVEIFIVFLITIYIETIASESEKILFIGDIFADKANKAVIEHPLITIISLGVLNILLYLISHITITKKAEKHLHKSMCRYIFEEIIKKSDNLENHNYKVSFLKVKKNWFNGKWYIFTFKPKPILKVVARYQTKQGKDRSKVSFLSGEGCAGKAYQMNSVTNESLVPYNNNNPDTYYRECENKLNLPKKKCMKLNEKACSFICVPISFFQTDEVIGVISVDSMNTSDFSGEQARGIEQIAKSYTTMFQS